MDAKDTVMNEAKIMVTRVNASRYLRPEQELGHPLITVEELAIATRQAEISFKAGMKEVVNWIKSNSKDALIRDSAPQMFMTGFAKWEWLVFLKENGLEE